MLAEAVDSVLKQSQKSLEVLIIDDSSSDGTEEFVKSIPDERVKYFRNATNSGPEFSRQFGLKQARGKYITFLDDDDYYTDYDFFTKAVKIFEEHEHENLAFVCANANMLFVESGKLIANDIGEPGIVRGLDFLFNTVTPLNLKAKYQKPYSTFPAVFKAKALRNAGLYDTIIFDFETYRRAAAAGDIWILADIVGLYRMHCESNTKGYSDKVKYSSYNARRYANLTGRIIQNRTLRDKLYSIADKKIVDKWYIETLYATKSFFMGNNKGFRDKLRVYYTLLKEAGFMPKLYVAMVWQILKARTISLSGRFTRKQN